MDVDNIQTDSGGTSHPFFDRSRAAGFLGTSLSVHCDPESSLVIPKAFSVGLFSAVLLEQFLASAFAALEQFREDIDEKAEHTPDAKSLIDFHEFAIDISEHSTGCVEPISFACHECPLLSAVCRDAMTCVSSFTGQIRVLTDSCSKELCAKQLPKLSNRPLLEQLDELQRLSYPLREKHYSIVRPCLSEMQIAARDASETLRRIIAQLRLEAGKIRKHLSVAEGICNTHGLLKSGSVEDAFQELKITPGAE